MNSLCELMGAAIVRILSRIRERPRATARPRRFRPLAEPMEARTVLSHVSFTQAIVAPIAIGHGHKPPAIVVGLQPASGASSARAGLDLGPGVAAPSGRVDMDGVEVNGQVEVQPGNAVRA